MTDTPQTDAQELVHSVSGASLQCVAVDFARKLERERDEAREDAKAADEHRRLAERLAERAMFERNQLRMRVAELESGIVVERAK